MTAPAFVSTSGQAPGGAVGFATFSPGGRLRWELRRAWPVLRDAEPRSMLLVGLNPSTAGARRDDHTVRRCRYFAQREGCNSFTVVNLSPVVATHPWELLADRCWLGPWDGQVLVNDVITQRAAVAADVVVVAWGSTLMTVGRVKERARWVLGLLGAADVRPYALGFTRDGHPRHPSRLPNSAPLLPYPAVGRGETVVKIIGGLL